MAEEKRVNNLEQNMSGIKKDIQYIKKALDENTVSMKEFQGKCDRRFVTRYEFVPVRMIVYGMVGFILVSVFGGILGLVIF